MQPKTKNSKKNSKKPIRLLWHIQMSYKPEKL
nr:MAG TPA: hypothetical protein [Caudoviricetes sp.]